MPTLYAPYSYLAGRQSGVQKPSLGLGVFGALEMAFSAVRAHSVRSFRYVQAEATS